MIINKKNNDYNEFILYNSHDMYYSLYIAILNI